MLTLEVKVATVLMNIDNDSITVAGWHPGALASEEHVCDQAARFVQFAAKKAVR